MLTPWCRVSSGSNGHMYPTYASSYLIEPDLLMVRYVTCTYCSITSAFIPPTILVVPDHLGTTKASLLRLPCASSAETRPGTHLPEIWSSEQGVFCVLPTMGHGPAERESVCVLVDIRDGVMLGRILFAFFIVSCKRSQLYSWDGDFLRQWWVDKPRNKSRSP